MKKILMMSLMLACTSAMLSASTVHRPTKEAVDSRGQPMVSEYTLTAYESGEVFEVTLMNVDTFAVVEPKVGIASATALNVMPGVVLEGDRKIRDVDWQGSNTSYITTSANEKYTNKPGGDRKVRDVDTGNLYVNTNTDKESAIIEKTASLPRGSDTVS